jgi:hypothetical protein
MKLIESLHFKNKWKLQSHWIWDLVIGKIAYIILFEKNLKFRFECPNGHYYVIGECGGAMEKSKCPECKEEIGGD